MPVRWPIRPAVLVGAVRAVGGAGATAALLSAVVSGTVAAGAHGTLGAATGAGLVPVASVTPATPADLPAGIEGLAPYVPANSCSPKAKPGATALGDLLRSTYPGSSYGIDRACGTDPLPTSEHYDGRAIDWFRSVRDPQQKADAEAAIRWLLAPDSAGNAYANARRLGVMYIIWNNRIWGSYRAAEGWRPYGSCATHSSTAYDTTCHRDHVHISLSWEGAMRRTSFWTRNVAGHEYGPCRAADLNWAGLYLKPRYTPCPGYPRVAAETGSSDLHRTLVTYSGMRLSQGSTGPVVRAVQGAVGAGADGVYGPLTKAAVSAWQSSHTLTPTGAVDAPTWRSLLAATAPQAEEPSTDPLAKYRDRVLRRRSHGPAVRALQGRLDIVVNGWFGPRTEHTVKRFQRREGLPVTGVVGPETWAALAA